VYPFPYFGRAFHYTCVGSFFWGWPESCIHTVHIRYSWQENYQIYSYIRCIYIRFWPNLFFLYVFHHASAKTHALSDPRTLWIIELDDQTHSVSTSKKRRRQDSICQGPSTCEANLTTHGYRAWLYNLHFFAN